jgi:preprotein translocase subunit SecD
MRTRPDWRLLRPSAALLLALLAAGGSAAQASSFQTWEVHRPASVKRSPLAFRLVHDQPGPGTLKLQGSDGKPVILSPKAILTQDDITKVEVVEIPQWRQDQPAQYVIYLYFKPDAAQRFRQFTLDHMGNSLAVVMDGSIFMTVTINSPIESPAMIEGRYYTRADATRAAERLAP